LSEDDRALIEALIERISALESELTTRKEKRQMNWLKRKIENWMSSFPAAEYDYQSPFGVFGGLM
jgi:t-SNARE complex subunit (syntaxin)